MAELTDVNGIPLNDDDVSINNELNDSKPVDQSNDEQIVPDTQLSGYQDELASGDAEDELQHEQGEAPAEFTLMQEPELKQELDAIAFDEQQYTNEQEGDDTREQVEDLDQDGKFNE